jgi:SAM-dependent methyltransferase
VKALLPFLVIAIACAACDRGATADRRAEDKRSDEQAEFDRERRPDVVIATIGLEPGDVVADIGAGTGLLTVHVARAVAPGGRVVATDVDAAVLDLLAARVADARLGTIVERRVVGPDDPGLEKATFDVILLAQVDHYFDDSAAWLRAALPALKPGGRVVITNRIHHRAGAMAAAEAAGLALVREVTDIPGQYVAVFTRK